MQTIAQSATTVNQATRKPDFIAAALESEITSYMIGALDAERGEMACPEMYYLKRVDCCLYCEGYEAVAGRTLTTDWFLGPRTPAITEADMEATLDAVFAPVVDNSQPDLFGEYEYAIEDDHEWIRQGC